jgi:cytochrome c oxidase subunit II
LVVRACEAAVVVAESASLLDPRGPAAARIAGLWWVMLAVAAVVLLVVVGMLLASVLRSRRPGGDPSAAVRWGEPFIVVAGVLAPALVLVTMFLASLRAMADLQRPETEARLEVRVTGHMWWWEARYPNGAVTANEIHIPAGRPVRLVLTSADVVHSFWVPQLQAKADLVPGRVNDLWIQADEPGRYRGQCAEFCGMQHALMIFWVVADQQQAFERWAAHNAAPAGVPLDSSAEEGRGVFLAQSCVGCHAVRGTQAAATAGPDLTHVMQRRTLGAGVLRNTRASLAAWIIDPQLPKPGAVMPPSDLTPAELESLLDYIESLK